MVAAGARIDASAPKPGGKALVRAAASRVAARISFGSRAASTREPRR
jgi:hypothetical protein